MRREFPCWSCQRGFAPQSAMIVHLETGGCSGRWTIQHLNAMAKNCIGFAKNLIKDRIPWFRAGAPRKFAFSGDKSSAGLWICYICLAERPTTESLTDHLQKSHSNDYPKVLSCPTCSRKFTKISGLLQHIETPKCKASYEESSIKALLEAVKREISAPDILTSSYKEPGVLYKLQSNAARPTKLLVKVSSTESLPGESYRAVEKRKRDSDTPSGRVSRMPFEYF